MKHQLIEMLSIDLSSRCSKGCSFCYNNSNPSGLIEWEVDEVIAFAEDCIDNGIKAVSLGGGEPFEYDGIFQIIQRLSLKCYISVTTNGLPLMKDNVMAKLTKNKPDKIHISIHYPDNNHEVTRVISQVDRIRSIGIKPGVNLLVDKYKLEQCKQAYREIRKILEPNQIILLPRRFDNTPTAEEIASVAREPFQAPSCLLRCIPSHNFVSVSWDKKVSHCSYSGRKAQLHELTYCGLIKALEANSFISCFNQPQ